MSTYVTSSLRLILCAALAVPWGTPAAAWNDDYRSYNNPNFRVNDFQTNFNNRLDLNFRPNVTLPTFEIRTPLAPALNINTWTMRLPEIKVPDIGNSMWSYEKVANHFNPEIKSFDHYQANISFKFNDNIAARSVLTDIGKMKFDQGKFAPRSFDRVYRDELGNTFTKVRTEQLSHTNDSYHKFILFYQKEGQLAHANRMLDPMRRDLKIPAEPSIELIEGFKEKWKMSIVDENGIRQKSTIHLQLDSIKNETNLHRFVSEYSGSLRDGKQAYSFTVIAPHEMDGKITSLSFKIEGKGIPTALINWKPVEGQSAEDVFSLLRQNLPVPLLAGPNTSLRLNGVDIVEAPLHVTPNGDISPKQIGAPKDLANLMGRQDLGIEVGFSAPGDFAKSGISLMNSLRNLGYMLTGRWSEVKGMRQELASMAKNDPAKFVLSAGFSDPSFMGIKDLRAAVANSKEINLPQTNVDWLSHVAPHIEFKAFTDPKGRTLSFAAPIALNEGRNGTFHLREPLKLPPQSIPAQLGIKEPAELTKATFKMVDETLTLTEGVVKAGQEKFYLDPKGDFTNINVFDQGLQKIETAKNHLENHSDRLTNKLSVSMDVTNNYLQNLHGVTGQILTTKIEMTNALMTHSKQVDAFTGDTNQLRASFENEDYGALQTNLPGLHDRQMALMKQEQTLGSQVQALSGFAEKLGALTKEAKTLIPKIDFDHMLTEPVTEQNFQFNSDYYFGDDKKILSGRANDTLDSIAGLAEAGLISRDTAKDWGRGIINARDRFMIAVPRMGYKIGHTIDVIKDPGTSLSYAVNRKADAMFFDRWERMIEKDAQGMVAFSAEGLFWSKIALGGSLVAGAIQAPFAMVVGFGSGLAAEKALVSMGVKEANARFYGGIVGVIAGAKLTSPQFVNKALSFSRNAWSKIGAVIENAEFGLPGMSRSIGRLMNSERGAVLIPEIPTNRAPPPVRVASSKFEIKGANEPVVKPGFELSTVTRGRINWQYDAMNPGPLADKTAKTFFGGKYNEGTVQPGQKFWKGGDAATPDGEYFNFEPPKSVAEVRVDGAVKPEWIKPDTSVLMGRSPVNSVISAEFPPGTVYYYGPTSYQGGVYSGGIDRIQIYVPNARAVGRFKVEYPLK